jgi:hypothetical protein
MGRGGWEGAGGDGYWGMRGVRMGREKSGGSPTPPYYALLDERDIL